MSLAVAIVEAEPVCPATGQPVEECACVELDDERPLVNLGISSARRLSAYDGVLGFVCGCEARFASHAPWREPWRIEITEPCAAHRPAPRRIG